MAGGRRTLGRARGLGYLSPHPNSPKCTTLNIWLMLSFLWKPAQGALLKDTSVEKGPAEPGSTKAVTFSHLSLVKREHTSLTPGAPALTIVCPLSFSNRRVAACGSTYTEFYREPKQLKDDEAIEMA